MYTIASGQLPSAPATIVPAIPGQERSVHLRLNNTGVGAETVTIAVNFANGSTSRRIFHCSIPASGGAIVPAIVLGPGDSLSGSATDATTVDFVATNGEGQLGLFQPAPAPNPQVYTANGNLATG